MKTGGVKNPSPSPPSNGEDEKGNQEGRRGGGGGMLTRAIFLPFPCLHRAAIVAQCVGGGWRRIFWSEEKEEERRRKVSSCPDRRRGPFFHPPTPSLLLFRGILIRRRRRRNGKMGPDNHFPLRDAPLPFPLCPGCAWETKAIKNRSCWHKESKSRITRGRRRRKRRRRRRTEKCFLPPCCPVPTPPRGVGEGERYSENCPAFNFPSPIPSLILSYI